MTITLTMQFDNLAELREFLGPKPVTDWCNGLPTPETSTRSEPVSAEEKTAVLTPQPIPSAVDAEFKEPGKRRGRPPKAKPIEAITDDVVQVTHSDPTEVIGQATFGLLTPTMRQDVEPVEPAPVPAPFFAYEDTGIREKIGQLVIRNRQQAVDLLARFGAKRGTELKSEDYAYFIAALDALLGEGNIAD